MAEDSYLVLLPITGAVAFSTGAGTTGTVEAEETLTLPAPAGTVLRLRNLFADELVSFLHRWVRATAPLTPQAPVKTVFEAQMLEINWVNWWALASKTSRSRSCHCRFASAWAASWGGKKRCAK